MTVVTFTDYTPIPRFDGNPWTDARIEGADASTGPWTTVETIPLSPVDSDPTSPATRSFTTEDATSETWFRIVFVDADGDESATDPVPYRPDLTGWLTDLPTVRAHLQKAATDTGQDDVIEQLIGAASQAIQDRYGQFRPVETADAKTFVWDGGHRLDLYPYYLQAGTSVTLDTDTSSTTVLATTDFQLRPLSPRDGVYRWIRLPNHQVQVGLERQVTVVGDWGYTTLPDNVEQACVITVAEWMRRGVQAFGSGYGAGDEDAGLAPAGLPMAAKRLLSRFDRWGQG